MRTYIQTGFREAVPKNNIYMYISPFTSRTWWAALEDRNAKEKNLEAIVADIPDEICVRNLIHKRKRAGSSYSDFLAKIEEIFNLVEYNKMTWAPFLTGVQWNYAENHN